MVARKKQGLVKIKYLDKNMLADDDHNLPKQSKEADDNNNKDENVPGRETAAC